jgi:hypothetical protein
LGVKDVSSTFSVDISVVQIMNTSSGTSTFSNMVVVDLPQSIAAKAIVNSRAPRGFVVGNADHISSVCSREVSVY